MDPFQKPVSPEIAQLLVTAPDAARLLAISTRLLWTLTRRGEIPCIRIGRAVRYDPHDLQAWIDRQKSAGIDLLSPRPDRSVSQERA